jgi:hypothetical protein
MPLEPMCTFLLLFPSNNGTANGGGGLATTGITNNVIFPDIHQDIRGESHAARQHMVAAPLVRNTADMGSRAPAAMIGRNHPRTVSRFTTSTVEKSSKASRVGGRKQEAAVGREEVPFVVLVGRFVASGMRKFAFAVVSRASRQLPAKVNPKIVLSGCIGKAIAPATMPILVGGVCFGGLMWIHSQ